MADHVQYNLNFLIIQKYPCLFRNWGNFNNGSFETMQCKLSLQTIKYVWYTKENRSEELTKKWKEAPSNTPPVQQCIKFQSKLKPQLTNGVPHWASVVWARCKYWFR